MQTICSFIIKKLAIHFVFCVNTYYYYCPCIITIKIMPLIVWLYIMRPRNHLTAALIQYIVYVCSYVCTYVANDSFICLCRCVLLCHIRIYIGVFITVRQNLEKQRDM